MTITSFNTIRTGSPRVRLLLVNPRQANQHYSTQIGMARLLGKKNVMPSLALPILAACTPRHYDVRIVDEAAGPLGQDSPADIVGITTLSASIDRAYEVADAFRRRGVKVVLGGPHVTYAPGEGLKHADSVVIGEAEEVWPEVLEDFEKDELAPIYQSEHRPTFRTNVVPRWDLVNMGHYLALPVQASRGCPLGCEFCLVTRMFGKRLRTRKVDDVLGEVASLPLRRVFFVDDNLTFDRAFARELARGLKGLGITWTCQAGIDVADEEQLLKEMADAGCEQILVGFESLNSESLAETHKRRNKPDTYTQAIERIHGAGIHVLASFIIGFDHDTLDDLDRICDFSLRTHLPFVTLNILGCSPGSDLHDRMQREGRLADVPSEFKGGMFPVLRYMHMSQSELFARYLDTLVKLYSYPTLCAKARSLFDKATFTRTKRDSDSGAAQKALVSLSLLAHHIFTRDRAKRRLLFCLIALAARRRIAVERAVVFLLAVEGLHRYIGYVAGEKDHFMEKIAAFDTGAYRTVRAQATACGSA